MKDIAPKLFIMAILFTVLVVTSVAIISSTYQLSVSLAFQEGLLFYLKIKPSINELGFIADNSGNQGSWTNFEPIPWKGFWNSDPGSIPKMPENTSKVQVDKTAHTLQR